MDAIEAARRRAASIHAAAIADGADPWSPLSFVIREVEREGLAAEAIEPGASQLDGAVAKFLPDVGLILYSDRGTEFERAFLVAHELGHALLGDAGGACEVELDRPTELSGDGEERVIAHGPLQRREIQMDLFARELLLPRPFVKDLHLTQDLSAREIADRIGADLGLAAQQLFDALLIPEAMDEPSRPSLKLNTNQQAAADHRGEAYLLEAGPGTGKTETLVGRVAGLLADGVDPRRVLVLTYSNKAAAELSERIAGDNAEALAAMWIGTFHAFGRDLLHMFGDRVGRSKTPALLDRLGAIDLLEHELPGLGLRRLRNLYDPTRLLREVLDAISRAQDEVCEAARYRSLAEEALARAEALSGDDEGRDAAIATAEESLDIAAIYQRYEDLKAQRGRVDFGDYVMLAVKLLEEHADVREYARKYVHVLVDEYQDVNQASVRLLKALCPNGGGLWAVGDARQSIYRFRGASSRNMARFKLDFPDAKGRDLLLNYRSRPEIVDLISHFGKNMTRVQGEGDPPPRPYEPLGTLDGPCGVKPDLTVVPNKTRQSSAIADTIEAAVKAGGNYRDHCVLVSGNDRLSDIGGELGALGIPTLFLGSLFERPEIKDLLCLLSLLSDPWGAGLLRTACLPEFEMPLEDVVSVMRRLREAVEAGTELDWIADVEALTETLSESGAKSLRALASALKGLSATQHVSETIAQLLLDRTRIAARLANRSHAAGRTAAIAVWQFINFARAQRGPEASSVSKLIVRVRRLLQSEDERELRQLPAAAASIDAVRLMTIHGAKGLQFQTVHLPGLNQDTMPRPLTRTKFPPPEGMLDHPRGAVADELAASHAEEQDCLFYVALSRARERLHLYRASHTTNNRERPASPFIARLGNCITVHASTPSRTVPQPPSAQPVPLNLPSAWRIEAWHMDTYNACPRRFLYLHLLRTGGRAHRTAFRRVHDGVRKVCTQLATEEALPDAETLARRVSEACEHPDITGHGHAEGLLSLAYELVQNYVALREGHTLQAQVVFEQIVGGDTIEVTAHEIVAGPAGTTVRMLMTGHYRDDDLDSAAARTLLVRASEVIPGARIEVIHLADAGARSVLELKSGAAKRLHTAADKRLSTIRSGKFPTKPDPRHCANCAAFLVCEALPTGMLDVTA